MTQHERDLAALRSKGFSHPAAQAREWMIYVLDVAGQRHRFVMHGAEADISERAAAVVAHEWPGGVVQAIETEEI